MTQLVALSEFQQVTMNTGGAFDLVDDQELAIEIPEAGDWDIEFKVRFYSPVSSGDLTTAWKTSDSGLNTQVRGCLGSTGTAASFTSYTDTNANVRVSFLTTEVTYQLTTLGPQVFYERGLIKNVTAGTIIGLRWCKATATDNILIRGRNSLMKATLARAA